MLALAVPQTDPNLRCGGMLDGIADSLLCNAVELVGHEGIGVHVRFDVREDRNIATGHG